MFSLKKGYLLSGIITGCILLFTFFSQLSDGKLHIIFCDVGQGDAVYIQFPDGKDMLIDGGPGGFTSPTGGKTPKVLGCLGKYMSVFDRTIDIVVLTHPQEDHLGGLQEIVKRYTVANFLHSDVGNITQGFETLMRLVKEKKIVDRLVATGEVITIGSAKLAVVWPPPQSSNILGAQSNVNDASVVLKISYGAFDALFPGDADSHVDGELIKIPLSDDIEVLKVPHHGSKTGMTEGFFQWLGNIKLAVISVGRNAYGHPAPEIITRLEKAGATVLRTDKDGNIEIVSDGKEWSVKR